MKKWLWGLVVGLTLLGAYAWAERTDLVSSPFAQWFQQGLYVGRANVFAPNNQVGVGLYDMFVGGDAGFNGNVSFPSSAAGGQLSYFAGGPPEALFGISQVTLANATKLGGYALPGVNSVGTSKAFTFMAFTGAVTVASGGGAANTVITTTDGTNTCTFTIPCNSNTPAGSQNTGGLRISAVNGSGSGCVYPAGANITASVTTAGCTTTQPTILAQFEGTWQ